MAQGWKGQTRGGAFGYRFFIWLIRKAGIRAAYVFLYFVVPYFVIFAPRAVRSVWSYSRKSLGYGRCRSAIMVLSNFYSLGQILIDKVAINGGMPDKYSFTYENRSRFLEILDGDTGVVMIGAHVGNWEIGVPFFDKYGKRLNIVMYDNEHEKVKRVLESNAMSHDYKVIPVNGDSLAHVFSIMDAIRNREYVCFQGDRYTGSDKTLSCMFLGHEARFPMGPFLLASRLRTPVVFYFAMREKGMEYRFHFEPVLPEEGKSDMRSLLEKYVSALERTVRKYPSQWFNYYDFWNYAQKN